MNRELNVLQIRSQFEDNGPGTQSLTIARELRSRGYNVIFASSGGHMLPNIEKADFKVLRLPLLARNKRDPLNVFRVIGQLSKVIKEHEISIVHAHNAAVAYCAYLAGKLSGRKISVAHSVRGIELRDNYSWRNWIYKFYPIKMIAVCEFTKNELIKLGANPKNITVSYNGVDLNKFDIEKATCEELYDEFPLRDKLVIGHVGSMSQDAKGQAVLIKAFAKIHTKYPDVRLLFVGDGQFRKTFEDLAVELDVSDKVFFAGMRFNIPQFQKLFDIFSLPSIWGEMFPNAIVEAMAMGNPWVGSDISGLKELSSNGKAGLVGPPGNVEVLSENLEKVISQPELRESMGKEALAEVKRKCTIVKVVDKVELVYHSNFS